MGGGGGSDEVKETQYQKELAKVAQSEWNRYQNVYEPLESQYMANVEQLGSEASFDRVSDDVSAAYQQQFGRAAEEQQKNLAAAGIDPSSGKAQSSRNELSDAQAIGESLATSQGQHSAAESYAGGMQNILAMGKGQQTQAIGSLQDISQAAQQKANQEAQIKASELSVGGALLGAGAAYASNNPEQVKSGLSNLSSAGSGRKDDYVDPTASFRY